MTFRDVTRMSPAHWRPRDLESLTVSEMRDLALLLGVATSGRREMLISRLLTCAEIRSILSTIDRIEELVEHYSLKDLQGMAIAVGIYRGQSKRGAAASLLNWRNQCRAKGQKVYAQSVDAYWEAKG